MLWLFVLWENYPYITGMFCWVPVYHPKLAVDKCILLTSNSTEFVDMYILSIMYVLVYAVFLLLSESETYTIINVMNHWRSHVSISPIGWDQHLHCLDLLARAFVRSEPVHSSSASLDDWSIVFCAVEWDVYILSPKGDIHCRHSQDLAFSPSWP